MRFRWLLGQTRDAIKASFDGIEFCGDVNDDSDWIDFLERALLRAQGWAIRDQLFCVVGGIIMFAIGYLFGGAK